MSNYKTTHYIDVERYVDQLLENNKDIADDVRLTQEQVGWLNYKAVQWVISRRLQGNGPVWFKENGKNYTTMGDLRTWWRELAAKPKRRRCSMTYAERPWKASAA